MIDNLTLVVDREPLSGANPGLIYVPITFDCNLQRVDILIDENAVGDIVFNLTKNGVAVPGTTLTISNGTRVEQSGVLDVDLVFGDELVLNMTSGALDPPITLNLVVDDNESSGGVTVHSALTGLSADDHPQYFNQSRGDARYAQSSAVTTALASKADLVSGKVPAAQLPSFVDDVLEHANFAALPAVGETGKIYITIDTNYEYRWSGSAYIRIVASPGTTDEVAEGSTNKYFTESRVLATVLTGLAAGANAVIAATDTIKVALQKIQAQISQNATDISNRIPTSYLDTDTTLAANSDTKLATQKAVKAYVAANVVTGGANSADIQIFTTTGANTWTKPAGAKTVEVFLIGGGGGGGSGRKGAASTNRGGGGGGGGGSMASSSFIASSLGSTETVTVGAGGTGSASQTVNSTNGNNGVVGGSSSFGTWLIALGGNFGGGGQNASSTAGAARAGFPTSAVTDGGAGGSGLIGLTNGAVGVATLLPPSGGGGGGNVTNANSVFSGGSGGTVGGGGTSSGKNSTLAGGTFNTNGNDSGNYAMSGGSGGGGGGASNTGNATAGGNGGLYGAGGGGGGGSTDSVGNSGAGGGGAPGIAVLVTYF